MVGLGGALLAVASGFQMTRLAYEESAYEPVARAGSLELRQYAPRVVAQTTVSGAASDVTSEGFRRIANYIFGGNLGDRTVAMTTPVEREGRGERIAMTTPVEEVATGDDWVITFTMPAEHSLDSLPRPNDSRVVLREVPARLVAVLRFSGRVDEASRQRHTEQLLALIRENGYQPAGAPSLAQYDPPWVLGLFRRNELHCPVRVAERSWVVRESALPIAPAAFELFSGYASWA